MSGTTTGKAGGLVGVTLGDPKEKDHAPKEYIDFSSTVQAQQSNVMTM
jgi:hypothetical protein